LRMARRRRRYRKCTESSEGTHNLICFRAAAQDVK
jgi:hypothetical protein